MYSGGKPSIISSTNKTEYFINQAKEIHGDIYDYSLTKYKSCNNKVKIICSKHGEFEQTPDSHLMGKGCRDCGYIGQDKIGGWSLQDWKLQAGKSNTFDSFKVYIIKCWNESEEFYKIGRTFNTIPYRFRSLPYNFEIMDLFIGTHKKMYQLEKILHKKHKHLSYTPKNNFSGSTECFKKLEL